MVLLTKNGILFVHIPKNCGKFVRDMLNNEFGKEKGWWGREKEEGVLMDMAHLHFPRLQREINVDDYRTVCVIRDPYQRFITAYDYCKREWYIQSPVRLRRLSMEAILEELDPETKQFSGELIHFAPQYRFIYDTDGVQKIKTLVRYENFEKDYVAFTGTSFTEKYSEVSHKLEERLSPRTVALINEKYAEDFKRLGYKMIEPSLHIFSPHIEEAPMDKLKEVTVSKEDCRRLS